MRAATIALAICIALLAPPRAMASPSEDVREVYRQFVTAQNMHDIEKVRSLLLDSPNFLWVSDGKSIWGRETAIERMGLFQQARVWHVDPALDRAVAVAVGDDTAFLHLPLELTIAFTAAEPERLRFLVSVLCRKTSQGWRIAALFTTTENAN